MDIDKLNSAYRAAMKGLEKGPKGRPRQFDEAQIKDIRLDPRPLWEIAQEYQVTKTTISAIKNGKMYDEVAGNSVIAPLGPRPKLQDADVAAIRASTESNKALAARYGVTPARIWQVRKNYETHGQAGPVALVDGQLVVNKRRLSKEATKALLEALDSRIKVPEGQEKLMGS